MPCAALAQRRHRSVRSCARPDRLAGLGAVPLQQDVDAACSELAAYVRNELGLLGVEIGTVAHGRELDDPVLVPFREQCNKLRAIVFIHPETAPGFERHRNVVGFGAAGAYPSETGVIAAKLLLGGYLTRFPDMTIVLSHGGGTLPWLLPRLDQLLVGAEGLASRLSSRCVSVGRGARVLLRYAHV